MTALIETMARVVFDRWRNGNNFQDRVPEWADLDQDDRDAWLTEMRENFAAIEAAGYRLVPVEPTLAQCAAGETAIRNIPRTGVVPEETEEAQDCYAAMLAAAPKVTG